VPTDASEPLGDVPGVVRRTYPGLRHESHNEPEGAAVIADVIVWLREAVASGVGE
jgi:alpha-beta hydrolase superfamily lysophospholipase